MIARVLVQTNAEGEQHVTITTDKTVSTEHMLVQAPEWEDSTIIEGKVLILSMDESEAHVQALLEVELHTAMTHHPEVLIQRAGRELLGGI